MNELAQIVATIGFPAAAFIMAAWYIVSKDKQHKEEINIMNQQHKEDIEALTKSHKEESNGLRRAIDQMTTAVRELLDEWRKAQ